MAAKRTRLAADWGTMSSMEKAEVIAFFMDTPGGSVSGNNVKIGQIAITGVQGAAVKAQMEAAEYKDFNVLLRDFFQSVAEDNINLADVFGVDSTDAE